MFWPCTYSDVGGDRCVNCKESHSKEHQNKNGKVIGTGPYQADFTFDGYCEYWYHDVLQGLTIFDKSLRPRTMRFLNVDKMARMRKFHHFDMSDFYYRAGGAERFVSHSFCLCCLTKMAEHPLPCGHVLCTPCVKDFGRPHPQNANSIVIGSCPLHDEKAKFMSPIEIGFRPPLAGLRILSLDG